jgi:hypothetical protein
MARPAVLRALLLLLAAAPAAGAGGPLLRASGAAPGREAAHDAAPRSFNGSNSLRTARRQSRRLSALGDAVQGCTLTSNSYPGWSTIPGAQGWQTLLCGDWFEAIDGNDYQACYLSCG